MAHPNGSSARAEIEQAILARAAVDPAYAELLRRDPRAAVADVLGVELAADLEVMVVEESPTLMCLVIPTHPVALHPHALASMTGEDIASWDKGRQPGLPPN